MSRPEPRRPNPADVANPPELIPLPAPELESPMASESKPHSTHLQAARDSYIRELRRNVREWTKARDEWIALAGRETEKSRECDAHVREAKGELRRLERAAELE